MTEATNNEMDMAIASEREWLGRVRSAMSAVIIGQDELIEKLLISLVVNGHTLLEGAPGLAKTLALKSLASLVNADFKRVQFTPDMLPADIIGTEIFNPKDFAFVVKRGPVFTNFLLADEINRAPAKAQSALLEAMQERQVSIGERTFKLPDPFITLATQNPIEQEGTYPLPEAQVDRFLFKALVEYPNKSDEKAILDFAARTEQNPRLEPVIDIERVLRARALIDKIHIDEAIKDYIVDIVDCTRKPTDYQMNIKPYIRLGASPRGTISLALAAKGKAMLDGRSYVVPQDVKDVAHDTLRHRILISYEAEAEGVKVDDLLTDILTNIAVP